MASRRVIRRWSLCIAVAIVVGLAGPHGRALAQFDGPPKDLADLYLRQGYAFHVIGQYGQSIELFRRSIEERPTAEGHTYLGWSLSHVGRVPEAIAECKKAIEIDPAFGNPYNDIGVYLIQLGRSEEAIPWLEKAMKSERYCCYQFPHVNLGHILLKQGKVGEARILFERALEIDPEYLPAKQALEEIRKSWL